MNSSISDKNRHHNCVGKDIFMIHKSKKPYVRDLYLAYLIDGAMLTTLDNYPVIEKWMIATELPKEIIQWDRRRDIKDPSTTAMCFYCNDSEFNPILGNPKAYVNKLKKYACVIGVDPSPYDNMPLVVQKSQIYINIAISFYFGKQGIKIIPNVRFGDDRTATCLEAFPKHTLIAVGTNGFTHKMENRINFARQIDLIIKKLSPSGIVVYGPASSEIFGLARLSGIPIYQYDSYMMKENRKDKENRLSEGKKDER